MKNLLAALLLSLLANTGFAQGGGLDTDWLPLVTGERCDSTGAEIMGVDTHADTGHHTVMVKLPKAVLDEAALMEEVRVVGKMPEQFEMPELFPELETEWVDDYDNDHYGLLVKLNSKQKTPIRLFFSTGETSWDGAVTP